MSPSADSSKLMYSSARSYSLFCLKIKWIYSKAKYLNSGVCNCQVIDIITLWNVWVMSLEETLKAINFFKHFRNLQESKCQFLHLPLMTWSMHAHNWTRPLRSALHGGFVHYTSSGISLGLPDPHIRQPLGFFYQRINFKKKITTVATSMFDSNIIKSLKMNKLKCDC